MAWNGLKLTTIWWKSKKGNQWRIWGNKLKGCNYLIMQMWSAIREAEIGRKAISAWANQLLFSSSIFQKLCISKSIFALEKYNITLVFVAAVCGEIITPKTDSKLKSLKGFMKNSSRLVWITKIRNLWKRWLGAESRWVMRARRGLAFVVPITETALKFYCQAVNRAN